MLMYQKIILTAATMMATKTVMGKRIWLRKLSHLFNKTHRLQSKLQMITVQFRHQSALSRTTCKDRMSET